jgi:hypothetical protein
MDALEGDSSSYSTWLELAGRALTSSLAELVQGTLRVLWERLERMVVRAEEAVA